jgi:hypothetical protein
MERPIRQLGKIRMLLYSNRIHSIRIVRSYLIGSERTIITE